MILFWSQTVAFSEGNLAFICNAKWIAYDEATQRDQVFVKRFLLAATMSSP
jgi:hypothetical protein